MEEKNKNNFFLNSIFNEDNVEKQENINRFSPSSTVKELKYGQQEKQVNGLSSSILLPQSSLTSQSSTFNSVESKDENFKKQQIISPSITTTYPGQFSSPQFSTGKNADKKEDKILHSMQSLAISENSNLTSSFGINSQNVNQVPQKQGSMQQTFYQDVQQPQHYQNHQPTPSQHYQTSQPLHHSSHESYHNNQPGSFIGDDTEDSQIESLIRNNGSSNNQNKLVIFSASFSDAETLKQLFCFLSDSVDVCPFHLTKDKITIFKTKKNNVGSNDPVMVINVDIDVDELYQYQIFHNYVSHKAQNFHGFNVNTKNLNSLSKNIKTNDCIKIIQYYGDLFLTCSIVSLRSSSKYFINITEYKPEKCDINSNVISPNIKPNINFLLNEFATHCASLTRIRNVMAPVHFYVYPEGLYVYSENNDTQRKNWGILDNNYFSFIFSASTIKNLKGLKKFNTRGVVKFFAVDNVVLRIDTSLSSFGYVNLYLIHQSTP